MSRQYDKSISTLIKHGITVKRVFTSEVMLYDEIRPYEIATEQWPELSALSFCGDGWALTLGSGDAQFEAFEKYAKVILEVNGYKKRERSSIITAMLVIGMAVEEALK